MTQEAEHTERPEAQGWFFLMLSESDAAKTCCVRDRSTAKFPDLIWEERNMLISSFGIAYEANEDNL